MLTTLLTRCVTGYYSITNHNRATFDHFIRATKVAIYLSTSNYVHVYCISMYIYLLYLCTYERTHYVYCIHMYIYLCCILQSPLSYMVVQMETFWLCSNIPYCTRHSRDNFLRLDHLVSKTFVAQAKAVNAFSVIAKYNASYR